MRVITGTARGTRLRAPEGPQTRPTSDMAKEAIFSILQFELPGAAVLDLFAGSGQLGIEALSRGARSCVFVDHARAAQEAVRENLEAAKLADKARVEAADAMVYLSGTQDRFDIALLDPPYGEKRIDAALPGVCALMRDKGVIVCETEKQEALPLKAGDYVQHKVYRYGRVKVTTYRKPEPGDNEE